MGLESATFISGLNANNPVGAVDPKSQGDDHLRLIKTTLLNTFPNITGEVTATQDDINQLVSNVPLLDAATNTFTGSITAGGTITGNLFSGSGASLTNLDATALTGEIADARLSANVPLLDANNSFTGVIQTIQGSSPRLILEETGADEDEGTTRVLANTAGLFISSLTDAGGAGNTLIDARRSGTTWSSLALAADSITANGSEVLTAATGVLLTGNQTIAGVKTFSDTPVFSDGATVDGAFRLNNVVTDTSGVAGDGSTTQNYAPTGHADADVFRISVSGVAAGELGGLAGPQDGRVVIIRNLGPNALQLQHENVGSTAANRFHLEGNVNKTLSSVNGSITLWYDGATSRWVEIANIGVT